MLTTQQVTYIDRYGIIHKKIVYTPDSVSALTAVRALIHQDSVITGARQLSSPDDLLHNYGSLSTS